MFAPKKDLRSFFLHFFILIALYLSIFGLLNLLFDYIMLCYPPNNNSFIYIYTFGLSNIRWNISVLLISFIVYLIGMHYSHKLYKNYSAKHSPTSWRFFIYLTLFLGGLFVLGDIIIAVYNLLGGEYTTAFILKALALLIVMAYILTFYVGELKAKWSGLQRKIFAGIAIVVVAASLLYGFYLNGLPQNVRAAGHDQQRVDDLTRISWMVNNYWNKNQNLPASLSVLSFVPADPKDNQTYDYKVLSKNSYQLCANFELPSSSHLEKNLKTNMMPNNTSQDWTHDKGLTCFTYTVE